MQSATTERVHRENLLPSAAGFLGGYADFGHSRRVYLARVLLASGWELANITAPES